MAVYRRGYQRYQGGLTGHMSRLLVLPRFAWKRLFEQRLVILILTISMFWPLACAAFVYVSNHAELWSGFGGNGGPLERLLQIDGTFFVVFMNSQSTFAVILAALAGPSLIAPDLTNGALPLYLSRPISRSEYVAARWMVLVGLLSPVTWIPGVLLFGMQSGMAGWTWTKENWFLGTGILLGFLLWILFVGLVAMASSAYVKWRVVAGALVLGFFFVLAGVAEMMRAVLRVDWVTALNPGRAMNQIWRWLLDVDPIPGPEAFTCLLGMLAMAAVLIFVLERKLRPVEVIS